LGFTVLIQVIIGAKKAWRYRTIDTLLEIHGFVFRERQRHVSLINPLSCRDIELFMSHLLQVFFIFPTSLSLDHIDFAWGQFVAALIALIHFIIFPDFRNVQNSFVPYYTHLILSFSSFHTGNTSIIAF
jgi:hypothetical protein